MSYYRVLGLNREPFSTSPDPDFLYRSPSHKAALNRLEIAIRLRRGLSLLLGDVGTGKTTLARTLVQAFRSEPQYKFHMMLDPHYETHQQFMLKLMRCFGIETKDDGNVAAIENYLFQKGVIENRIVVLVVDEGQKLSVGAIEVLRTLLNYETNEFKLLQLIIMGQLEFIDIGGKIRNFMDRVAFKYLLNPLDEQETKTMIDYRLQQAGYSSRYPLFTKEAIQEIYSSSRGYPRRITSLCHQSLERLIMNGKSIIDRNIVQEIIEEEKNIHKAFSQKEKTVNPENILK